MSAEQKPYDPNSIDSMLSRIVTNQEAHSKKLDAVLEQATRTNGRVTSLEMWREVTKARVAIVATVAGGAAGLLFEAIKYFS